jgi:small GTP-binding protein
MLSLQYIQSSQSTSSPGPSPSASPSASLTPIFISITSRFDSPTSTSTSTSFTSLTSLTSLHTHPASHRKDFVVRGRRIRAQIWDTAGQERFRGLPKLYYRAAHGVFIVFDMTDSESFEACSRWLAEARTYVSHTTPIILLGNKCDLSDLRAVQADQAHKFQLENKLSSYHETSAKRADNVYAVFQQLIELIEDVQNPSSPSSTSRSGVRYRKSFLKASENRPENRRRPSYTDPSMYTDNARPIRVSAVGENRGRKGSQSVKNNAADNAKCCS